MTTIYRNVSITATNVDDSLLNHLTPERFNDLDIRTGAERVCDGSYPLWVVLCEGRRLDGVVIERNRRGQYDVYFSASGCTYTFVTLTSARIWAGEYLGV